MKKLFATLLALAMVLSMSVCAFADGPYTDVEEVTIAKTYTVTNESTSYPDETFMFTIERTNVKDSGVNVTVDSMPLPTISDVTFNTKDGTATKNVTIELPEYNSVGIYTYTIKETAGDTAGVTYYGKDISLVVTVIEQNGKVRVAAVHTEEAGGNKSNAIENVYSAGSLSVSKTVTGNLGDKDKYFKINVMLTGVAGQDYSGNVIAVGDTSYPENPTSVAVGTPATFYLKDGETVTLGNIPYGVTYEVTEEDLTDYSESITGGTGTIVKASQSVSVVNNKEGAVDTGISLDSMPYILMLAVAVIGCVALVGKKRVD